MDELACKAIVATGTCWGIGRVAAVQAVSAGCRVVLRSAVACPWNETTSRSGRWRRSTSRNGGLWDSAVASVHAQGSGSLVNLGPRGRLDFGRAICSGTSVAGPQAVSCRSEAVGGGLSSVRAHGASHFVTIIGTAEKVAPAMEIELAFPGASVQLVTLPMSSGGLTAQRGRLAGPSRP